MILNGRSLTLSGMKISRSSIYWCVVLFISIPTSLAFAETGADLPPPPTEAVDTSALSIDESAAADATLPELPELLAPEQTTEAAAPKTDPKAETEAAVEPSLVPEDALPAVDENFPPLPEESAAATQLSPDMAEAPPALTPEAEPAQSTPARSSQFSSHTELMDLGMEERLKTKELVLWLYFGGSYGSVDAKGVLASTSTTTSGSPGGIGYNAGLGWMLSGNLQMGLDFVGTPRTTTTTVDSAMFGIGPKLGFISIMALLGAQNGENIVNVGAGKNVLMAYGLKGGIDIILGHAKDSRVSYGIAPEVYYITPQTSIGGYTQLGATVAFRIYGYENIF